MGLLLFPLLSYSQGSPDIDETLITVYFEQFWNQGNLDVIEQVIPPQFILHYLGKPDTANYEEDKAVISYWRGAIPYYSLTIEGILADENKGAARFSFTGTHKDTPWGYL